MGVCYNKYSPYGEKYITDQVLKAIRNHDDLSYGPQENELIDQIKKEYDPSLIPGSKEIFSLNEKLLPCWLDQDIDQNDDWLINPNYYPLYYSIFKNIIQRNPTIRFLEIGVRTGYMAAVFAKANKHNHCTHYWGVDPNLYISEGLKLAGETLRLLYENNKNLNYTLLYGLSTDPSVQKTLLYSAPFHLIHIDGDHSYEGKLVDLILSRELSTSNTIVMVDDFDHIPVIKKAVFKSIQMGWYKSYSYIPTKRGLALLYI